MASMTLEDDMENSLWSLVRIITSAVMFAFVMSRGPLFAQDLDRDARAPEWRALARSLRLVDIRPGIHVTLIDPDLAADPAAITPLDAFIVRNPNGDLRPVIYINHRSAIVRKASNGDERAVEELAAVIHHEARHLAGDSEKEARDAERQFLQSLASRTLTRVEPLSSFRP
jgi:hypothetical protein